MRKKTVTFIDYEDFMQEELIDHEFVKLYLAEALKEDNPLIFKQALLRVVKANGGVKELAEKLKLDRTGLYSSLSPKGNPSFAKLVSILRVTGFELDIRSAT